MELATLRYAEGAWSEPFPALDSEHTLVLAFASSDYRHEPAILAELAHAYPRSALIGCSTAGEIDHARIVDDSIVVSVVKFRAARVRRAIAPLRTSSASFAAGSTIAGQLIAPELRAVILLSDGLVPNGSELLRGLNSRLPASVVVTGGMAADRDRFHHSWVVAGGEIASNAVVAVGLYGPSVRVTSGSRGGFDPFGPERLVTSSAGSVLHTVDGRPALALYKEYLGELAADLPGAAQLFPLALRPPHDETHSVVRAVLGVDELTQSLRFGGDIPTGHYVRLMRANFDRLIFGAHAAGVAAAATGEHAGPTLSLAISCVGRRLVLRERTEEETEATVHASPACATQIGFYSYGEFAAVGAGRADLHNQTMTVTMLSEA